MTREQFESAVWRNAAALSGAPSDAGNAMDAILRAADAYARQRADEILAARDALLAARLYAPDDAEVTAERRRRLAAAVAPPQRKGAAAHRAVLEYEAAAFGREHGHESRRRWLRSAA